jgi:hypothetical protein
MSEHGKRQHLADGDPAPVVARCGSTIPHGAHGPRFGGPAWCAGNQNIVTAHTAACVDCDHDLTERRAVCSVCRQPDPEGAHRHASE